MSVFAHRASGLVRVRIGTVLVLYYHTELEIVKTNWPIKRPVCHIEIYKLGSQNYENI